MFEELSQRVLFPRCYLFIFCKVENAGSASSKCDDSIILFGLLYNDVKKTVCLCRCVRVDFPIKK